MLDHTRLLSFFTAVDRIIHRPTSIMFVNQGLKAGRSLEDVLCVSYDKDVPARFRMVFELEVEQLEPNAYEISFGVRSSTVGDGGSWRVRFGPNGEVLELNMKEAWNV